MSVALASLPVLAGAIAALAAPVLELSGLGTFGLAAGIIFLGLFLGSSLTSAHSFRLLVRTYFSNTATLMEASVWLVFPQYVVTDRSQFGPWRGRPSLPLVGQVLAIDVPEVLVPVDNGLYCLRVNTKVMGVVEAYTVEDLVRNPVSVESCCNDVIAHTLRSAVFDKPLEEALKEIQRLFLQDSDSISKLLSVPAFRATRLLLDADQHVKPADQATAQAMELVVQRRQEVARRQAVEAAMETERQKVELHRIELQTSRDDFMLQQEAYGKEGAAMIEAAKHAKSLYLFSGGACMGASTVLTLPS